MLSESGFEKTCRHLKEINKQTKKAQEDKKLRERDRKVKRSEQHPAKEGD
jgi:hypothetical protein